MKKHKDGIDSICSVNTIYSLFLYLLLVKDISKTWFFFGDGINPKISDKFSNKCILKNSFTNRQLWLLYRLIISLYLFCYVRVFKLKGLKYYGQDHLAWSQFLIKNSSHTYILEDGLKNYICPDMIRAKNHDHILHRLYSKYICIPPFGMSKYVTNIYLTRLMAIPKMIENKAIYVHIQDLWNGLSDDHRRKISNIFCVDELNAFDLSRRDVILLTQCFDVDGIMSEDDKICMYKNKLKDIDNNRLLIKVHPREHTDYRMHFPGAIILNTIIPFELLLLLVEHTLCESIDVYSHSSTCSYNLSQKFKIHRFIDE